MAALGPFAAGPRDSFRRGSRDCRLRSPWGRSASDDPNNDSTCDCHDTRRDPHCPRFHTPLRDSTGLLHSPFSLCPGQLPSPQPSPGGRGGSWRLLTAGGLGVATCDGLVFPQIGLGLCGQRKSDLRVGLLPAAARSRPARGRTARRRFGFRQRPRDSQTMRCSRAAASRSSWLAATASGCAAPGRAAAIGTGRDARFRRPYRRPRRRCRGEPKGFGGAAGKPGKAMSSLRPGVPGATADWLLPRRPRAEKRPASVPEAA